MTAAPASAPNCVADFKSAMAAAGVATKDAIVGDGKLRRVHVDGDKPGARNGWYVLFADGTPAGRFGNWKSGTDETWAAKQHHHRSPAEQNELRRRMEDARRQRTEELRRVQTEAAVRATAIWERAETALDDHPYLAGKGVAAHGLRIHRGLLVVPMRDVDGTLHSLQFIGADGEKRFLTGGRKSGCFHIIGNLDGAVRVCLAEGYATAVTVHQATRCPVVITFDAGNLPPVAKAVRAKLPDSQIMIAADNDQWTAA
jgi:putative DNA primase/helicase